MKHAMLLGVFVLLSLTPYAHDKPNPDFYWVVETNAKDRSYSIVKLYNLQNELVYEVRLVGVFVNIRNARQKRMLDQMLRNYSERSTATVSRFGPKRSGLTKGARNLPVRLQQS